MKKKVKTVFFSRYHLYFIYGTVRFLRVFFLIQLFYVPKFMLPSNSNESLKDVVSTLSPSFCKVCGNLIITGLLCTVLQQR